MKNIQDLYSKTCNTLLRRPKFWNHAHASDDNIIDTVTILFKLGYRFSTTVIKIHAVFPCRNCQDEPKSIEMQKTQKSQNNFEKWNAKL